MGNRAEQIRQFILANVASNPSAIAKLTANEFAVSSVTIHRHISTLINAGKLMKIGSTRDSKYYLQNEYDRTRSYSTASEEHKIFNDFDDIIKPLPKNIYDICYFGVTEMLNNAIDHSRGTSIKMTTKLQSTNFIIEITDDGVGAFKTICDALHISDFREGILHISKGKITRDPVNHTGQGIFFTSRAFDQFIINANGYCYTKDNVLHDWSFKTMQSGRGTTITMTININSTNTLREVFAEYEGEDWAFDKTEVLISLADLGENDFISRSQAKRVLIGLEKFSVVTLDFKGINSVGQGFVDEIFRVFTAQHTGISIRFINANENVTFMIERSGNIKAR